MGLTIYLDGDFVPQEKAVISVFDHGLLYGDGVFEGIRAYNNRVFRLEEHIERFYESAKTIMMDLPMSQEEMADVVLETCRRNNLQDAYIRLVATRGVGDLGLDPHKCGKPTIFCIAASIQLYNEELYTKGLELVTVPTRRNLAEATNPRIKSLNYLNNIFGKIEAHLAGVAEAIMINQEGYVAEATGDNLFIVKKGKLITPPIHAGILEGVTRNCVMELAVEKGITVEEKLFTRHDIFNADECFLTGTAAECIPVIKVDGRVIGSGKPGDITWDLISAFREQTQTDGPVIFKE
ncbi:MAG: branched-chain-amino-acid transaminase [Clostridiales bacterium]|nr:branched-chain-amino-acid transaminase [Clostridiales bacterium]MCF8022439.1 branched-chain-amino-acid transaminase [Clostridiales bacterium]